jgi:pimeloyl-ACP methyl ester carboxylesterase
MHLSDPLVESFQAFLTRSAQLPGQSHFIDAKGTRLHYLEWPGPVGAPTILLLHGFLAHAHWWDFIAPWLAEDYRVIAPDFSGMGESAYRPEYRVDLFADEIEAIVAATGIKGCLAVGHSFGGRVLLLACAKYQHLFSRAVVVDSRIGTQDDPMRGFNDAWRPKKIYADEATILQRFALRPEEPAPAAALLHMGRASIRQVDKGWTWKFDDQLTKLFAVSDATQEDDSPALRKVLIPVDLIYGEHSIIATRARAEALRKTLVHTQTVTCLPACYHHIPVSQPQPLLAALRLLAQLKNP